MWYTYNEALVSLKEEKNYGVCRKMSGTGDHHGDKPSSERQKASFHLNAGSRQKTDNSI
jgi:hypothetical protein